ncbi:MAG: Ig-like domain-containing protein, partial [Myxococcales bacterium]
EEKDCTSPFEVKALPEGSHTIRVTATDGQGNAQSKEVTFTLDRTPPQTTLGTGIPALTREASHVVTFSSDDPRARFECRLNSAGFSTCASPFTVSGYGDGAHTFEIRAVDEAGNVDATPVSLSFTADRTPPVTTLAPLADDGADSRAIAFSADDAAATFECSVNGSAFAPCTSPLQLSGLADGTVTVVVRATDAAGNREDPGATVSFLVDATPPDTTVLSGPTGFVNQTSAVLHFSSSEANSTFSCSLNGASFSACTSPHTQPVVEGAQVFQVRASDRYGNTDATPAEHRWTVDLTPPVVSFTTAIQSPHRQPTLTVDFDADEPVTQFECSFDGAAFAPCTSPVTLTNLSDTTASGTPHVFAVRATDRAANLGPAEETVFQVDLSAPAPAVPKIIPLVPSVISNTTPTLAWEPANDATAYDLEISTDATFADATRVVQSYPDLTGTQQVTTALAAGRYFYRVRAKNGTGPSAWSEPGVVQVRIWWQVTPAPTSDTMYGIACRNSSQCVAVGVGGLVLRTLDGGKTFQHIASPTTQTLNAVAHAEGDTLVALGFGGALMRSTDFGASWTMITTDKDGAPIPNVILSGVSFKGPIGVLGGASGVLMLSTDAGATWELLPK